MCGGGGDDAAAHEGDDNSPSGPTGRGVKKAGAQTNIIYKPIQIASLAVCWKLYSSAAVNVLFSVVPFLTSDQITITRYEDGHNEWKLKDNKTTTSCESMIS